MGKNRLCEVFIKRKLDKCCSYTSRTVKNCNKIYTTGLPGVFYHLSWPESYHSVVRMWKSDITLKAASQRGLNISTGLCKTTHSNAYYVDRVSPTLQLQTPKTNLVSPWDPGVQKYIFKPTMGFDVLLWMWACSLPIVTISITFVSNWKK